MFTEMFRDQALLGDLRDKIIPKVISSSRPLKIWHAGCSSGEEVHSYGHSVAQDAYPEQRVTIHATDLDPKILEIAKAGTFRSNISK